MNRLLTLSACLLATLMATAQLSFSDATMSLTDPTHFSGNAVCVQDVNGDGLDDIVILDDARQLKIEYQNLDGSWTSYEGPIMDDGNAWGMAVADMDHNGFSDVFSGLSGGNPDYARADANGSDWTREELTGYPLFFQGSSLADFDGDGDLDYYVCADTDESAIWANDGAGNMTFSGTSIIDLTVEGWDGSGNYGSTASDFDLDGDLDLYISHCRQGVQLATDPRRINQLFVNDGNNNYTEAAADYGLAIGSQTWTSDFADIDNDGDFDIFMTNHDVNNMLWRNDDGVYTDIFDGSGLDQSVLLPIQGIMKDFDNDGFVDILVSGSSHALYRNNGDGTFERLADLFNDNDIMSFAVGDVNHDGFLDIYASYGNIFNSPSADPDRLWINEGNDHNFLTVDLQGTASNESAVGTVVRAYGPWGVQVREVRAGESYGIVNSLQMHFGMGTYTLIDSLIVDWPSGAQNFVEEVAVNQFIHFIEGECVTIVPQIDAGDDLVLCAGDVVELSLDLDSGSTVTWSTGETTPSIVVDQEGVYMAQITTLNGCTAVTTSVQVSASPDETPQLTAMGETVFCAGGSVMLTASDADAYMWSDGSEGQSIEVTEAGSYTVTIDGACESFTSAPIEVDVLATAESSYSVDMPMTGESAVVEVTTDAQEVRWYDEPVGGELLATGATYTTPPLDDAVTVWYEAVAVYGGEEYFGAKEARSVTAGQFHQNSDNYLIFDAFEDMVLNSVRVYAGSSGERTIQLIDNDGQIIATRSMNVSPGESVMNLDIEVPQGEDYSLRTVGAPDLWRDNDPAGVNFPYDLGVLGSITGTSVSQQSADNYYYFFYDWNVSAVRTECADERQEVIIDVISGLSEGEGYDRISIYPNPASEYLEVVFDGIDSSVSIALYDMSGREVMPRMTVDAAGTEHIVLPLSDLSAGSYTLQIRGAGGMRTETLMVR